MTQRLTTKNFNEKDIVMPVRTEPIEFDGKAVGQHVYLEPGEGDRIHVGQVSSEYQLIPNGEALATCRNAIVEAGFSEAEQWGTLFNGRRFQTTLVCDEGWEAKKDDRIHVGFRIMNSYDGSTKLRIQAMLFRVLCSNGMISTKHMNGVEIMHKGNQVKELPDIAAQLSDTFRQMERLIPIFQKLMEIEFTWHFLMAILANVNNQFTGQATHALYKAAPNSMWECYNTMTKLLNKPKSFGDVNTLDTVTTNLLNETNGL